MALPGNKKFSDYDNYITDQNPTTSAQAQDYFRNQAELLKAVIDCDFWQPETVYQPGDVVKSDSMPNGTEAVMVATKASVTSNVEPQWGAVGGANIPDGACFWKLRSRDINSTIDKERPIKTFTSLEQIGLDNTASEIDIAEKTPINSVLYTRIGAGSNPTNYPNFTLKRDINLIVEKGGGANDILFTAISNINNDFRIYKGAYTVWVTNKFSGWNRLFGENNIATQTQAKTGTDNTTVMTPLRVFEAIKELSPVKSVNGQVGDVNIIPVGTVIPYLGQNVPEGYLDCEGAGLKSTTYTQLFNVIGTTFGTGDGIDADFNLPNLNNGSFLEGSDIVGVAKEAGLPNIVGILGSAVGDGKTGNDNGTGNIGGAFAFNPDYDSNAKTGSSSWNSLGVDFDASRCSVIYGASDTVQPKSVTVKYCIKY